MYAAPPNEGSTPTPHLQNANNLLTSFTVQAMAISATRTCYDPEEEEDAEEEVEVVGTFLPFFLRSVSFLLVSSSNATNQQATTLHDRLEETNASEDDEKDGN